MHAQSRPDAFVHSPSFALYAHANADASVRDASQATHAATADTWYVAVTVEAHVAVVSAWLTACRRTAVVASDGAACTQLDAAVGARTLVIIVTFVLKASSGIMREFPCCSGYFLSYKTRIFSAVFNRHIELPKHDIQVLAHATVYMTLERQM